MAHFKNGVYYFNNHTTGYARKNEFKICVTSQKKPAPTKAPTSGARHTHHTQWCLLPEGAFLRYNMDCMSLLALVYKLGV